MGKVGEHMLTIKQLSKRYDRHGEFVFNNLSLQIKSGERVMVLGPSGVGKSTLIRCINRLVEPTGGTVTWQNTEVTSLKKRELSILRRRIGMVFQGFHLINQMTARDNVMIGTFGSLGLAQIIFKRFPADALEKARKALNEVNLLTFENQRVSNLSGGQRQRVAIARAIVQRPELLLCDEPVASVDPVTAKRIMAYLVKVCEDKEMTAIINCHDIEIAKQYGTRIIGLSKKGIVFDGMPDELDETAVESIYEPS
jgi:phosphonate transport system ATP-binding protein